jgi:hypothetical protein
MTSWLIAIGWMKKPPTVFDKPADPDETVYYNVSGDEEDEEEGEDEADEEEAGLFESVQYEESSGQYEYRRVENGLYWLREKNDDREVWLLANQHHPAVQFCFNLRQQEIDVIRRFQNIQTIDVDKLQAEGGIVPGVLGYFVEEKLQADPDFHVRGATSLPPVEPYYIEGEPMPIGARSKFSSGVDTEETFARPQMHLRRFTVVSISQPGVYEEPANVSPVARDERVLWYTLDTAYYALYLAAREKWLNSTSLLRQISSSDLYLPQNLTGSQLLEHLRDVAARQDTNTAALTAKLDQLRHAVSVAIAADEVESFAVRKAFSEVEAVFSRLAVSD